MPRSNRSHKYNPCFEPHGFCSVCASVQITPLECGTLPRPHRFYRVGRQQGLPPKQQ